MKEPTIHLTTPVAEETNPILLWLYKHGWESPEWGKRPANQVALGLALHDLIERVSNEKLKGQMQVLAQQVVAENAVLITKTASLQRAVK